ncbi:polyamine ABC transporter, ATP-binding protein [Faecalibacterium prausnitzii M21/2]|jgi:spermidine/putrescine transport system ATP-binding protein|nr:polyamine ABC transporter, ATP-binding protein [Faecalibacterium prausnitzii M21/2]
MLLCGAEHPLYAKKMGQVPCLFSYLRTRRITYKMDNSVVVSLRDIVVEFDGQRILDGLNLDIHDKEFVTLLGSSGCGKTTTLRLIAGFLEPNAGKVLLKGKDITGVPPYKRPVNTVFQKYALFPHLNVFENVAFGLRLKKLDEDTIRRKVRDMLEVVGLKGFERRSISQMSGGQQQRVAIARSLVNEPEILLLDEPLGALDLKLRKEMQLELKRLQREMNITFIYVTHDQEEALTMSDTVVVMNGGKVQQIGTPEDIYNEPKNAFVADFIGDSNIVDGVMHKDFLVSFSGVDFPCVDRGFAREQSVQVVVRPEDIEVVSPVEGQLVGVVNDVIFKGVHFEMHVECEGREWLIHSTRACTPGETIGMRIGPNEIHIMARSEG